MINPNTVAKAYRELEHEGVIELRHGAGAFVSANAQRTEGSPTRCAPAADRRAQRSSGCARAASADEEIRRLFEAELAGLRQDGRAAWLTRSSKSSDLRKTYGERRGARGLNLQRAARLDLRLLGRNGAGKTTTIKMLLGMARPTSGTTGRIGLAADVPEHEPRDPAPHVRSSARTRISTTSMTVAEIVRFTAAVFSALARAISSSGVSAQARAAGRSKVKHAVARHAHEARAAARALRGRGAADPRRADRRPRSGETEEVLQALVGHVARDGVTVLLSTHQIADIEQIADHVAIVDRGRTSRRRAARRSARELSARAARLRGRGAEDDVRLARGRRRAPRGPRADRAGARGRRRRRGRSSGARRGFRRRAAGHAEGDLSRDRRRGEVDGMG